MDEERPDTGPEMGPGGPRRMPPMWRVVLDSLGDAWRLAKADRAAVALLFSIQLLIGTLQLLAGSGGRGSDLPYLTATLSLLLALPFTLRFCALLLGRGDPRSFPPTIWPRLVGWGIFCVILGQIGEASALPLPLPFPVTAALSLGSLYFQIRLLPLYPAIMSWPDWPGIDRVWTPSGRFVLPLIGCALAVYLPLALIGAEFLALKTGAATAHDDPVSTTAHLEHMLGPVLPVLTVLIALFGTAATLFGAALRVRLFRLIS